MSQVTYTGVTGPGTALTARVFPNVKQFAMDFDKRTLQLNFVENDGTPREIVLDMSGATVTLTDTITANDHVIAVSVA